MYEDLDERNEDIEVQEWVCSDGHDPTTEVRCPECGEHFRGD